MDWSVKKIKSGSYVCWFGLKKKKKVNPDSPRAPLPPRPPNLQLLLQLLLHSPSPPLLHSSSTPPPLLSLSASRTLPDTMSNHVRDIPGSPKESYKMLYSYLYMLEQVNPGTKTCLKLDDRSKFEYLFIALGACIEGFAVMRKVIAVEGIRLKNGGVLVSRKLRILMVRVIHLRLQ
ncbi:uncharacterized protein LOC106442086 [Brassica napus]|uniref:uncharacterized protein LOC106442086 n=1 Tax=Brassica napus TaxID=3708 RepID=UPI002078D314|nr:uncharacterized protein LOC106442086 [Brassica napus]